MFPTLSNHIFRFSAIALPASSIIKDAVNVDLTMREFTKDEIKQTIEKSWIGVELVDWTWFNEQSPTDKIGKVGKVVAQEHCEDGSVKLTFEICPIDDSSAQERRESTIIDIVWNRMKEISVNHKCAVEFEMVGQELTKTIENIQMCSESMRKGAVVTHYEFIPTTVTEKLQDYVKGKKIAISSPFQYINNDE